MKWRSEHPIMSDITELDRDFYVVSAGWYSLKTMDMTGARPEGRNDYFLFHVLEGESRFMLNGEWQTAVPGDTVFYNINAPQQYRHLAKANTVIYWVHFQGIKAEARLRQMGIHKSAKFHTSSGLSLFFETILQELTFHKKEYFSICAANLTQILAILSREQMPTPHREEKLDQVISLMHSMSNHSMTVTDFAALCNLSKSQFIRSFTAYTGVTPKKYQNNILMHNARWHLRNTELTVQEIAMILHYENVYHFSNAFKAANGISPKAYRIQYRAEQQMRSAQQKKNEAGE